MFDQPAADPPSPGRVRTRQDFARELTLLREQAGLTVRQVASKVGVQGAHSTIGDWFAGRGLPSTTSRDVLVRVLTACGVSDAGLVEQWLQAWQRVRRAPGRRAGGQEPYRGLSSFRCEDADWFFGRRALTGQLIARVADLHAAGGGVQVVVGASGSGKSSLLRAGVIAALRAGAVAGSARWPVMLLTPGSRPVDELAAKLAVLTGLPAGEMAGAIRADPALCAEYARQATTGQEARSAAGDPDAVDTTAGDAARFLGDHQLVLVIDQLEEVFTACADDKERRVFFSALCASAAGPGGALVVLGLRADFYAHALRYPQLVAAIQAGQLAVGPMKERELREAIVAPARKARIDIEDGLVELLLREVAPRDENRAEGEAHESGVLPLLSHALYATWSRGQGRRLTITDYRDVGGIDGAVATSASKVYDGLTGQQQELARHLFLSLVHIAADTADTRRRLTTADLLAGYGHSRAAEMEKVLSQFVTQRLITADTHTVEISHEALLTAWPQLRTWLDTDRAGLIMSRRLAEAALTWRREHYDPAALYRGTRLAAARDWVETRPHADLPPLAREFLDAAIRRELGEQRVARRRTRLLRQLVAGLVVLFLLTAAAAGAAVRSQHVTREQRNIALSGKVANEATALRNTNPALAVQLSVAAYRLAPTPEARGSLLSTFATPYATQLTGHTSAVYAAEFSPDGRILATGSIDRSVRLWDITDRHRPHVIVTLTGHTDGVTSAVFSPDGHTLATASADHTARLWDVTDPRHPRTLATLSGHTDGIRRLAFSPDGRMLATASADHTARLWDVTDPRHPRSLATLTGHREGLAAAVFSADGHTLATAGADNPVRLWDITDPRHPQPLAELTGHTDRVLAAVFSPDGHTLATGSFDNTIRLWDITDPHHPGALATLSGHTNGVVALAFSPDGHTLATGSYDLTVRLWDITDPRKASAPTTLSGHAGTIYSVAFSPDGNALATASKDNTARLWEVHGSVLTGHYGGVKAAAFSPNGHILAAGNFQTARLWNITDPDHPDPLATLTGHTDGVSSVAFSPDGHTLATAGLDATVRLWDVTDPNHPVLLATVTADIQNVFTVAFSPDGRTLATGGADRTARLWDITDPRHPSAVATLTAHTDAVGSVVFSPDGRILATGSADRTIRLWDITDPRHPGALTTLTGHANSVNSVAFSPDGHTLATGSTDHTARLWDITDPHRPALLATLTGHSDSVNSVSFSPDAHTLATAGSDNTARLWDITNLRHPGPSATLTSHTDAVDSVAFSPDGHTLATGSDDTTARLWDTDPDRVTTRVCAFAYPPITHAEWSQYLPDLAYQPPCQ
ncbi:MAG: helix-turn-helix domain-containing protein [Pseudonocardiales bacterium]|nr:helix-turn-helix domain-containing protein [Pseudonocardiales bacterium]MBV9031655.1 helix-turn-helix domain-containing protein [Pseudonocardiales bacterium]